MTRRGRRANRKRIDSAEESKLLRRQARVYFGSSGAVVSDVPAYEPDKTTFATKLKMRRDPIIALGLWTMKAPICVSDFTIKCDDRVIAAFVDKNIRPLWPSLLRTSLKMLDFGWQPHELLWKIEDVAVDYQPCPEPGASERPEPRVAELRSMYQLERLKDINPSTCRPMYHVDTDEFVGITQRSTGNLQRFEIDKGKLYIPTFDSEWGNVEGKSLLDNAYRPWYYSYVIEQLWARFMERRAIPPLVGTGPHGTRVDEDGNSVNVEDVMLTILNNIHHGNGAYLPFEPDQVTGKNQWSIEALQFFSQTDQFQTFLATMDGRCLRGLLTPEKTLIQGTKVGTLSETSQFTDTFMIGLDNIQAMLQNMIQEQIVDRLVRINFVNPAPCSIEMTQITAQRRASFADLVNLLGDAQDTNSAGVPYRFKDLLDFDKIASQLGVPVKDPEDILRRDETDEVPGGESQAADRTATAGASAN